MRIRASSSSRKAPRRRKKASLEGTACEAWGLQEEKPWSVQCPTRTIRSLRQTIPILRPRVRPFRRRRRSPICRRVFPPRHQIRYRHQGSRSAFPRTTRRKFPRCPVARASARPLERDGWMSELGQKEREFGAEETRQGEIILRTRRRRVIFIAGLVGI